MADTMKTIQTYECRLRASRVLRLADVAGETHVRCAEALARVGHALIRNVPHEQVWLILLGGALDIRGAVRLSEGGLHGTALRPSDVFRPVFLAACDSFALVHNHPSGDPTPSEADRVMTRIMHEAAEIIGLHLLDHVVVTRDVTRWHAMGPDGQA